MRSAKYIFFILVLINISSCVRPKKENNLLDTIQSILDNINSKNPYTKVETKFVGKADPIIFEASYFEGTRATQKLLNYSFKLLDIGKIKIESGKIIACDPIVMHDGIAFTQIFPKGEFPVQLAMAETNGDRRVAFSRILFSDNDVTKWEFALHPGQKPIGLRDTTFYCYGVDAGMGIFIDENSNKNFSSYSENNWDNAFVDKAEKSNHTGYIHKFGDHNVAVFSTGYGDGCYATYIGYDEKGDVCRLLCDFGLIAWWKVKE